MWLPDGQPWLSALDAQSWVMLPAIGSTSAQPDLKLSDSSSLPESNPPQPSMRSAVSWLRKMREIGERSAPGKALALRRLSLTVLCLTNLAACSLLRPKPPDPPPPAKCPIVQCLDRALVLCQGVDPVPVKNCADAVLLASDALGEIVVCQESHAALIRCVEQFNFDHGR